MPAIDSRVAAKPIDIVSSFASTPGLLVSRCSGDTSTLRTVAVMSHGQGATFAADEDAQEEDEVEEEER